MRMWNDCNNCTSTHGAIKIRRLLKMNIWEKAIVICIVTWVMIGIIPWTITVLQLMLGFAVGVIAVLLVLLIKVSLWDLDL